MMPALGKEKIIITLFILVVTTILSWVNQIKVYKQIKELITFEKIVDKVVNQTVREKEHDALLGMAWKTLLPLFLWGLMAENNILIN